MKKSVTQLLMKIYGGRADAHLDLYRLSNRHRRKHGWDCDMYPSDPLQAPLWRVVGAMNQAGRNLEGGCGHRDTAAVMGFAGGAELPVGTHETRPREST